MAHILHNTHDFDKSIADLNSLIRRMITDDDIDSYVIIVPTGKIVRYLERKILFDYYNANNKPLSIFKIYTINDFAENCFRSYEESRHYRLISEAYRLALFEEAADNAELKFFKGRKGISSALLDKLMSIIVGLKKDGLTTDDIKNNLEESLKSQNQFKVDTDRLTDILELYQNYQSLLGNKYLDDADLLNLCTNLIDSNSQITSEALADNKMILFSGFTEFKAPELKFIYALSRLQFNVVINIEYDVSEGPLYTILEKSINTLTDSGMFLSKLEHSSDIEHPLINHLKRYLFGYEFNKNPEFSSFIKIIEATNRIDEVILISRLVKYLILKEGYTSSDICVAARNPDLYSHLFDEIFYTHKIPANITDRFELSRSSVISGIIAALNLLGNDFKREDFVKFLNNPYLIISSDEDNPIDLENLVALSFELRILGGKRRNGKSDWFNRLNTAKKINEKRIENYQNNLLADEFDIANAKIQLRRIKKALQDFRIIDVKLTVDENRIEPIAFADIIKDKIVKGFQIVDKISNRVDFAELSKSNYSKIEKNQIVEDTEKDAKALKSFIDVLNEMTNIMSERAPGKKHLIADLTDKLKVAISGKKYQITEKIGYGVTVTTIEQTRKIPYKVLILCGAVDGEFPIMYRPETFLGMELPDTEQRHILSERMQFYQFLANGPEHWHSNKKKIYISYPTMQEDNELVRSPFVDALLNVSTIKDDECVLNANKIKKGLLNSSVDSDFDKLIQDNSWLYSVASDIDVNREFGDAVVSQNEERIELIKQTAYNNSFFDAAELAIKEKRNKKPAIVKLDLSPISSELRNVCEEIASKPISISQLELYAKCPYQFYLKRILRLDEPTVLEPGMTPLEMGNLMHKILFEFYSEKAIQELQSAKYNDTENQRDEELPSLIPVCLDMNRRNEYLDHLNGIAERNISEINYDHPQFKIDEEAVLGRNDRKGLIEYWLDAELERINNGWETSPVLFEFAFGMKSLSSYSMSYVELDGLKLKGKVDRIEVNQGKKKFLIADYKLTSKSSFSLNQIKNGQVFQLPLYTMAIEKIFKENYGLDYNASVGVHYYFKSNYDKNNNKETCKIYPLSKKDDENEILGLLSDSLNAAKKIVEKIGNGEFNIEPLSNACNYCSFAPICRIRTF